MNPTERLRLARRSTYLALAAVAVVVDAAFVGRAAGLGGLIGFGTVAALLIVALVLPAERSGLHRFAAVAAVLVALATAGGDDGFGAAWPRILVLVFAGLALEADRAVRFARAFAIGQPPGFPVGTASLAAAIVLALALEAGLRSLLAAVGGDGAPTTPDGFLVAALSGGTPVHRALLVLFFAVVVLIGFAAIEHLRERAVYAGFAGQGEAKADLAAFSDTLVAARLQRAAGTPGAASALIAHRGLAAESRRLVRAMISFLPLLGFLGTVVGLATAIAALRDVGPGQAGAAGIAASLSGLAVKFETTLLGLGAALVASALLALLERAEGELEVAVARLAGADDARG